MWDGPGKRFQRESAHLYLLDELNAFLRLILDWKNVRRTESPRNIEWVAEEIKAL